MRLFHLGKQNYSRDLYWFNKSICQAALETVKRRAGFHANFLFNKEQMGKSSTQKHVAALKRARTELRAAQPCCVIMFWGWITPTNHLYTLSKWNAQGIIWDRKALRKWRIHYHTSLLSLNSFPLFAALVREIVPWLNLKYECDYKTQI